MRVEGADIRSPEALALISALNAELSAAYADTPGANHFRVDANEVAPGRGAYVIAWRDQTPIGCGAVRRLDDATAEIKRMYVVPSERSAGIGRLIVGALEHRARALGVARIVLETGTKQAAAIALYEKLGFERIPPFGEYVASAATSVCMAKPLRPEVSA
jgi:putative acetyltransferase